MKKCTICDELKDTSNFTKDRSKNDGINLRCKKCNSLNSINWRRSKNGVALSIYNDQVNHSKTRGHKPPDYSKTQLLDWIFSDPLFNTIYDNWVMSGYDKYKKPSVDRIDDYKGYSFDNIQLMTWGENKKKGDSDRLSGKNNKVSKTVVQYDVNGKFITEHHSISSAGRSSGVCFKNIFRAIRDNGTAGGFVWDYKY